MFLMGDTVAAILKHVLIFVVNLASEGHLLVGKFMFTSGEFRKAGWENVLVKNALGRYTCFKMTEIFVGIQSMHFVILDFLSS